MPRKLRIGTDCSGIEAPIEALKQLKIPHIHVFSSEIDKYCIQSIKANHSPKILFGDPDGPYKDGDIRNRDNTILPDIDLYVCGFPCQPFSSAGKRKGSKDKRGNVFWGCYEVIIEIQPKYFILENVKGILTSNNGDDWDIIYNALKDLEELGYQIEWKVLNTKDYGIPQNRERLYIVGTKGKMFIWPNVIKNKPLEKFIDYKANYIEEPYKSRKPYLRDMKKQIFVDLGFVTKTKYVNADKLAPCIMAKPTYWCVRMNRYATVKEMFSLQGFKKIVQVVSNSQMKKQIGNSMSVNVLKSIYKNLIK